MNRDYHIEIRVEPNLPESARLDHEKLINAASQVLSAEHTNPAASLTIVICSDTTIQELNRAYRQQDCPTDVLAFPAERLPEEITENQDYLGDILIGLPYLARRAKEENHDLHNNMMLMVIHGCLHLLGYTHDTAESQTLMWARQSNALQALGIDIEVPDYIHG